MVIAEIELTQESEQLQLPIWIGKEVTSDFAYKKINMLAQRRRGPR
jgi:CYTH domain-containing protein